MVSKAAKRATRRVSLDCSEPVVTKQSFKDECDINNIMAKYKRTGSVQFANDIAKGRYLDLSSSFDFKRSLDKVIAAQRAFDALPAHVRAEFKNDPAEMLAFVSDPKNQDRAVTLGLAEPKEPSTGAPAGAGAGSSAAPASAGAGLPHSPSAPAGAVG